MNDTGRTRNFGKVLRRDDKLCRYCEADADCVDHIIPWCYSRSNDPSNLASACGSCNSVAGDFLFDSFADKAFYILQRRKLLVGFETIDGRFISTDIPLMPESEPKAKVKRTRPNAFPEYKGPKPKVKAKPKASQTVRKRPTQAQRMEAARLIAGWSR